MKLKTTCTIYLLIARVPLVAVALQELRLGPEGPRLDGGEDGGGELGRGVGVGEAGQVESRAGEGWAGLAGVRAGQARHHAAVGAGDATGGVTEKHKTSEKLARCLYKQNLN